jgi:hypothetical protein
MIEIDSRRRRRRFGCLEELAAVTFLSTLAISAGASGSYAAEDSYGGFDHYFHLDHMEVGPDHCVAEATINYDGVLSQMSVIRDAWLSQEKTTEFYQRHTLEIIFDIVDHKAGGVLLEIVYENKQTKNPDKCHFSLSLAKADDFGQVKSYPQLSWDFNAALASRIVWNTFDDRNLSKIALNYKFTPEANRLLKEQNGEPPPAQTTDAPNHPRSCADIMALEVADAFGNSPYAQSRHLKVLDATNPKPLPQRANRGFACISKLVTNGGTLNVFVEPKLVNGQWYVTVEPIP